MRGFSSGQRQTNWLFSLLTICCMLSACSTVAVNRPSTSTAAQENAVHLAAGEKLRVVATLNILADVVKNVGGDHIELHTLLPVGADPHSYSASPADLRTLSDAHVIFTVGNGLEESLHKVLENREGSGVSVAVNSGLELATMSGQEDEHGGVDPHTWTSPLNVAHWVTVIEQTLQALDPANAPAYAEAAQTYTRQLEQLDTDIQAAVAQLPSANRKLVTDHEVFGYFAARYGFTVVGTVIPALSTLASPSAQELAALQDQIKQEEVKAIFVGTTMNPDLAQQIASDAGVPLIPLYSESLSAADGPAATYVDFMRYDVEAIVEALR